MNISKCCLMPLFLGSFTVGIALGQQTLQATVKTPEIPSQAETLSGQLVYHDGLRKWYELKLDRAESGQSSIQLVYAGQVWKQIQALRRCRVRSRGLIFPSPTGPYTSGYYPLEYTQSVQHIESVETCTLKPPIQVVPTAKPDKNVHDYRVDMRVNYSPGDHPVVFRVTSAGKELQPWQTYASYELQPWASYVSYKLPRSALYGICGEGFVIDRVFGTPQASPSHLTVSRDSLDMAIAIRRAQFRPAIRTCILGTPAFASRKRISKKQDYDSVLGGLWTIGKCQVSLITRHRASFQTLHKRLLDRVELKGPDLPGWLSRSSAILC